MSNYTYALSLNTIQYVDGVIYGSTVVGGNILAIDCFGTTEQIWRNDFSDQSNGGVFMYSVLFSGKIYFFPYLYNTVVIYDFNKKNIEKIEFTEKEKDENLFPHIYNECLYIIGTKTGKVWIIQSNAITIFHQREPYIHDIIKQNSSLENRFVFFQNHNSTGYAIFDFELNKWIINETNEVVTYGFADDKDIYYFTEQALKIHSIESETEFEIKKIEMSVNHPSAVRIDNKLLFFSDQSNEYYTLDLKDMTTDTVNIDSFTDHHLHYTFNISEEKLLLVNIEILDWIFRKGDNYTIYDIRNKTFVNITMLKMERNNQILFNQLFMKVVGYGIENDTNDLSCFVDMINQMKE